MEVERDDAQTKASNCQFEESGSVGNYGYFSSTRKVKGIHDSEGAGSYKFVSRKTFGVLEVKGREAASSAKPVKNRPLSGNAGSDAAFYPTGSEPQSPSAPNSQ